MSSSKVPKKSAGYRETLNLPHTDFPMKANLPQTEPAILELWQKIDIYKRVRAARKGCPKSVLHDGPPYANGQLHIGHAVNKILKDAVVKSYTLNGQDSPYVPGWDCHGLPIEVNVEKKEGRPRTAEEKTAFRQKCREYASYWLNIQRKDFQRMGLIGDWENPYVTMDFQVEANIIRALAIIYKNQHIRQGYKPVQWCLDCSSALAEAEVEYKPKQSVGVHIAFPLIREAEFAKKLGTPIDGEGEISFVIWTTTPWTIPANRAVTLHPALDYVLLQTMLHGRQRRLLVAAALADKLMKAYGVQFSKKLRVIKGNLLGGLQLKHPYYDRPSLVTLGDYVTTEAGTGLVHSAPAYGIEDFAVGKRYELPLDNPVNDYGYYADETEKVGGWHIFKDEQRLVELLEKSGCLIHQEKYEHQYPHCWRHKKPTIYRATTQWFISMSHAQLIDQILAITPQVRWIPSWGQERIEEMMKNRPDWCISRQRHWGVPIPFFVHKKTRQPHPRTLEFLAQIADLIEKKGIEAWYELRMEEFLDGKEAQDYIKDKHILDVWFDSGTTHFSVLRRRNELDYPARIYLEGSDQHRGWFQSSLLAGVAMDGQSPYKEVLTHGFTVDGEGHKMSKSVGNVIEPQRVINEMGADILRWWVLATDYSNEIAISPEILASHADVYRRIRNTVRFLLANINDFDPERDLLPHEELLSLDRWIIRMAAELQKEIKKDMADYAFPIVCRKIHLFCVHELGSFYLDIIKDRQYTTPKNSHLRRSAQSAMFRVLEAMVRWLAPLLSFTAEEIWQHLPGDRDATVFTANWYEGLTFSTKKEPLSLKEWQRIIKIKEEINKRMEAMRDAKKIGTALEAEVALHCSDDVYVLLSKLGKELRFLFIVSLVELKKKEGEGFEFDLKKSQHEKCSRCWHRVADRGANKEHPELCLRCVKNLSLPGEEREHF